MIRVDSSQEDRGFFTYYFHRDPLRVERSRGDSFYCLNVSDVIHYAPIPSAEVIVPIRVGLATGATGSVAAGVAAACAAEARDSSCACKVTISALAATSWADKSG